MGSATPMMANAANHQSPVFAAEALGGAGAAAASQRPATPTDFHDGASTMSRTSDAALFSGADAAIMADAFRKALRKPEFPEGSSPDEATNEDGPSQLLNQELADEGRDIRSVESSRGVRVETLSDNGVPTLTDNPH